MTVTTMTRSARVLVGAAALVLLAAGPLTAQFPTDPPAPTELEPLQFPPFQEASLGNGLTILLVENHRLPIVSLNLAMRAGSRDDPAGRAGLVDMVSELLTKGTERRTAEEIAAEIEGVGASIFASGGADFFNVYTTVLADDTQLGFDMLSDVVLNSTYPEEELELARTRMLSGLRAERSSPSAIANRFFFQELYGDHPYARSADEESVSAMTREEIVQWANDYLKPEGSLLVVAGDITLEDATQMAEQYFGSWSGARPEGTYAAPPTASATDILLVHRPGSPQSNVLMGNLALPVGHPAYFPAVVGGKILGGGADARLFLILREEKSWTYGAYASMARRADVGYWRANTEVRTEVTDSALVEIIKQVRRLRTEAVPDSELAGAKGYLVGSFPLQIQTPQQIASTVASVRLLGLGEDYLRTYRQRLDAVTSSDIMRAARLMAKPDSAVVVVVGDGQALYPVLSAVAPVRIIDVEGEPLTPDDLAPKVTSLKLDLDQIVARRDSFQMLAQGNPIGYQVTDMSFADDGTAHYTEEVAIAVMGMTQNSQVSMQLDPFVMGSVSQTVSMQGMKAVTALTYADGRVSGQAQTPNPPTGEITSLDVDSEVIDGVIDDNAVQALIPALPLVPGESVTVNIFRGGKNSAGQLTFAAEGVEEVTVPAGTFQALRVEVSGGDAPLLFYVSQETPRRIVKLEIVGQPVGFELVK